MTDIPAWLQGLAAMAVVAGGLWFTIERKIDASEARMASRIESESTERKRDVERIDGELSGLADIRNGLAELGGTVAGALQKFQATGELIGARVQGLAERFGDYKVANDKSNDEIKHALRNLEQKASSLAVAQARRHDES